MYAWRAENFCWLTQHDNITNIESVEQNISTNTKKIKKEKKNEGKREQTNWVIEKFAVWPLKFEFSHSNQKQSCEPNEKN